MIHRSSAVRSKWSEVLELTTKVLKQKKNNIKRTFGSPRKKIKFCRMLRV